MSTSRQPADAARDWLVGEIARRAGLAREDVDEDRPFAAYGLPSTEVAALAAALSDELGVEVDVGTVFAHPTVAMLAGHLAGREGGAQRVATPASATPASATSSASPAEALAIVGIGCRMPGASGPDELWRLLAEGRDAVSEVPPERWDADALWDPDSRTPGKTVSRWGGFVAAVDRFDAGFFGIRDDEAAQMDPQQRLLLEVAWEALEDAGQPPSRLRGSTAGVFVGISASEYAWRQRQRRTEIEPHSATGGALSIAANRLSYVLDLHGPSVAVDTACSSSLVALHLAARSLRAGETDLALVAGVNLLLDPELTIALSRAGMLSPHGRCKAFARDADGYVRGEGVGVVVLKRASAAEREGDRVYALVRGTAVNQDGRANGLTAPNPRAQTAVVRAACADAGVDPREVAYVECHGTGTPLGDPLEAQALGAVVGVDRAGRPPCLVGSVKSNLGHLEAAAGIAGLVKTALALERGVVPPTLHCAQPSEAIDFDGLGLRLAREPTALADEARLAGVSSFGFGGTNAHAVLERPRAAPRGGADGDGGPLIVPISARTAASLDRLAGAWSEWLASSTPPLRDIARTAATRRDHHAYRRAVVARDAGELRDGLARERPPARPARRPPRVAFVFPGQGTQFAGMARGLLDADALFASTLRRCDEALAAQGMDLSVVAALREASDAELADTALAQPVLVALGIGLAAVIRANGVEPAAVVGHSVGEIAAAHVAGCLPLAPAMALAAARGAAMAGTRDAGRMLAIGVAPAEAEALARRFDVDVAAVNGPAAAVVAGPADALVRMREELAQQGRFARWLAVGYAFHSRAMHAAADRMAAAAAAAGTGRAGTVPLLSTVTGGQLDGTALDAAHWGANVRETVRFAGAVGAALDAGVDAFVELGPQAALATPLAQTAAERDVDAAVVHALERGRDDRVALLAALAQLYERGCELRWARLLGSAGRVVSLPRPQWEQRSHWLPRAEPEPPAHAGHWLLGARLELADAGELSVWEGSLDVRALPFLRDHRVGGDVVLPAAGFAELALAAVREGDGAAPVALRDMRFERPLRLGDAPARIQVTLRGGDGDGGSVAVHAAGATASWTAHARARAETCAAPARIELAAARARCDEPVAVDELYAALAARGLDYGPAFRALRAVRRGRLEAVARVEVDGSGGESFVCDPRVLDAAFHAVLAAIGDVAPDGLPVPVAIDELVHAHAPARAADVHVELDPAAPEGVVRADVRICDEDGSVAVAVHGLTLTALMAARPSAGALAEPVAAARPAEPDGPVRLYETEWRERPRERARDARGRWVLFDDGEGLGGRLSRALERAGGETLRVVPGPLFEQRAPGVVALDPARRQDLERLVDAAAAGDGPPLRGFVHLWGAGSWPPGHAGVAAAEEHCAALIELVRALSLAPALADAELTLVTRGCHAIEPSDRAPGALAAALWGLLKVLPFEVPVLTYRCVDLDPADVEVDALLHELLAEGDEVEIAHRRGRRLVRRLARAAPACPRRQGPAPPVTAGGAYLVTGGFGGLGLAVASWLAERGAGTVALMGREGPRPGAAEALARLRSAGVELLELRGDVRSSGDVDAAFERLARAPGRLGGVVHAAGVLDDGPLLGLTRASLATVLGPKLAGAWNVAAAARRHGVDWLAFFSSAAAVLGSPGQASYCAANAFLDGFAASLRAEGFRALSVGWGPWAEAGMAADADLALSTTVNAIAPADGVRTLERLLADGRVHALALGFDLRHIIQFYPSGRGLSLLDEVTDETTALLRNAGRRAEPAERPALTREYVAPRTPLEERVAAIWQSALGMSPIGVYDGFFELGGDSVFANQIIFEIGSALGVRIDPVSAFEDFTIARLAELAEASMVERLEQMSDEEAVRLIEGEG